VPPIAIFRAVYSGHITVQAPWRGGVRCAGRLGDYVSVSKHGQRAAIQAAAQSEEDARARSLLAAADAGVEAPPSELEPLAARAKDGDVRAREELIERMLPTISSLARSFRTEGLDHADLVQEGIVGLLRALTRYEPARGTPFRAWAAWWIRQALQEAHSDFVRPLRLPPAALRQLAQLKAEHERIYASERRDANVEELASRVQVERGQADALLRADQRPRSLDEPVEGAEGELGSLGALLADPLSTDAFEEVLDAVAGEQLRALLARLTEREREIVDARFGFGRPSERLVEIGDRLGISAERVRQLEERALAKLRQAG
jgi:RNA polymerase sigma factor (sigma-70 family)